MNMAKRKYSKMRKIEPSVYELFFSLPSVTDQNTDFSYIDISQCVSLMNRRFYRQGLNWAVSGIEVTDTGGSTSGVTLQVNKLWNSWTMSNAWEKSFRAWQQMIRDATDDAGSQSIKGKFLDFKIYANSIHHNFGFPANLVPQDSGGNAANLGQWQPSDVTIPAIGTGAITDYELIAVGPNDPGVGASGKNAKSIIQGYADSRALPDIEDPNVPADASLNWMMSLFNEGTLQDNAVTGMLEVTGDQAPYPYEGDGTFTDTMYPGGETNLPALQLHSVDAITSTTVGGKTYIPGGNFPCGLIELRIENNSGRDFEGAILKITLVPGNHRGYLAQSMVGM